MSELSIRGLRAGYDGPEVLSGVDLDVASGSLACLVGPSGSGKSTLLRCVAGLHPGATGAISVGADRLDGLPPQRRRVGLVPQDAALFTHLDVARNVGYGLFRLPRPQRRARVAELLELTGLSELARRLPAELSGGQQQRVALARALAPRPRVLLLDEPFSGLDPQLRAELRRQVRRILASLQTTALLVSHDRDEALSLADQVVVMRDGRVRQSGPPAQVYRQPADLWTGRFVGEAVQLDGVSDGERVRCPLGTLAHEPRPPGPVRVLLRPEQLRLQPAEAREDGPLAVASTTYRGRDWLVRATTAGGEEVVAAMATEPAVGDRLAVEVSGLALVFET